MNDNPPTLQAGLRLLVLDSTAGHAPWHAALPALQSAGVALTAAPSWEAWQPEAGDLPDVVLAVAPPAPLPQQSYEMAVVLVAADAVIEAEALHWLASGVQDVLSPAEAADPARLLRALRYAASRKRLEREARRAYATDLATGLPNHGQLIEHMSQLLALRERQPAPMALLVLRLDGLQRHEALLGAEAVNVLRRKIAVRLRVGVRASDVVAALGDDAFAVLLSAIESPADAERVVQKLGQALAQPFTSAGQSVRVAADIGVARWPDDGTDPHQLLRRATAEAALTVGAASPVGGMPSAANDDQAP
jgi:diguanylate cyclase (GGDEF)-like protein